MMAERSAIFSKTAGRPQIGYIEGNKAFDLLGRERCSFNAASGNLCDFDTGKIVGHVSLEGQFVGASWLADELFGRRDDDVDRASVRSVAEAPSQYPSGGDGEAAAARLELPAISIGDQQADSSPWDDASDQPMSHSLVTLPVPEPTLTAPDPVALTSTETEYESVERAIEMIQSVLEKRPA
jgi:hypothetical protein